MTSIESNKEEEPFRATCYSISFLLTKHFLLSILLLMIIWSLVKIPMMSEFMANQKVFASDMPVEYMEKIKVFVLFSRILVIIVAAFGVLGIIRESFNLLLMFDVFMFFRLIAIFYVPYFDTGIVSNLLLSVITIMSVMFTYLLAAKDDYLDDESEKTKDQLTSIAI